MGLLMDSAYWANVVNAMWQLRPARSEVLPLDDAISILSICCKSLTDLNNDPELETDLNQALSLTENLNIPFEDFLDEFQRAEVALAMQSGVEERAAQELGQSIREVQKHLIDTSTRDQLVFDTLRKIEYSQKMACASYRSEISALEMRDNKSMWQRGWQATKGVATISFNATAGAGAIAALPGVGDIVAGTFAGASVISGAGMVGDSWRGYW